MSGCLKSSYGVLCLVTSWMLIAIGLTFLHLGAAVTGFVTGDVAGRFWIQHRFHVSREEAFRRPLQLLLGRKFLLRLSVEPASDQVPAAAEAIAQDTRLGERAAAYTVSHEAMHEHEDGSAELERAPVDAAAAEGADGITAADVVEDTLFEAVPLSFLEGSDVAMQANAAIAGA